MKIAVLFDGAGLARLGLELAGHECEGFELNPIAHYLGTFVGNSGRLGHTRLQDVRDVDLSGYDAIWASPPCQKRSSARTQGDALGAYAEDLLEWSLSLADRFPGKIVWVENIMSQRESENAWGAKWNAAQFLPIPLQNRNRIVGGRYPLPCVFTGYRKAFPKVCPCITATEYKGCASDTRRASRFYGRRLTVDECAHHMGFSVPAEWWKPAFDMTPGRWQHELYRAIGNGVPTHMAFQFGMAAHYAADLTRGEWAWHEPHVPVGN